MARIAIDIDDTLTNSSQLVKEYALLYDSKYSNEKILINRLDTILRGFFDHEAIENFFLDYGMEIANKVEIKPNAKEIIDLLRSEGHEIYIITARSDKYYKNSYEFCKNYLNKNSIYFDKLITSKLYKIEACKEENIDIMIDDGVDTCDNLNKEGIKAFLFTSELNKDKETISQRVSSWNDVYNKICEYTIK